MPRAPAPPDAPTADGERIAKLLARAGIASRREVERMIAEGRVAIDGTAVATPATLLRSLAGVTVDGRPVAAPAPARLFLYHKPPGLLVTERDPAGRPTIYDRLPAGLPRVVPVGRLDLATEGLLLLTTDGGLKRTLELPATGVERTYRVRAYGPVTQAQLEELIEGVEIDGVRYGSIDANLERRTGANVWIELTLTEGKNREVRRVLEHLGLQVGRLIRTRYGPFVLGDLAPGEVGEARQHDLVAFRQSLTGRKASTLPERVAVEPIAVAADKAPAKAGKAADAQATNGQPRRSSAATRNDSGSDPSPRRSRGVSGRTAGASAGSDRTSPRRSDPVGSFRVEERSSRRMPGSDTAPSAPASARTGGGRRGPRTEQTTGARSGPPPGRPRREREARDDATTERPRPASARADRSGRTRDRDARDRSPPARQEQSPRRQGHGSPSQPLQDTSAGRRPGRAGRGGDTERPPRRPADDAAGGRSQRPPRGEGRSGGKRQPSRTDDPSGGGERPTRRGGSPSRRGKPTGQGPAKPRRPR